MCRKNQLWGCAIAAFGVGLLISLFFESGFFCSCIGFGLICVGVVLGKK